MTPEQKRMVYIKFSDMVLNKARITLFREEEKVSAASPSFVNYIYKYVFSFCFGKSD